MTVKIGTLSCVIANGLKVYYNSNEYYSKKSEFSIVFNLDLFSPTLPINLKTYKYDPNSKFPNPDWEYNTKILYQILEYTLKNFKLVEGYRHIKDNEFEYYSYEQLMKNLKIYLGWYSSF